MSAPIKDRPYPFEVKTALFQLFGLAISTPKDVADINVDFQAYVDRVTVTVYVGGYDVKINNSAQMSEGFYLDGKPGDELAKEIDNTMAKIAGLIANGRKLKAKRLRDEAEALMKKATEIEMADATN